MYDPSRIRLTAGRIWNAPSPTGLDIVAVVVVDELDSDNTEAI